MIAVYLVLGLVRLRLAATGTSTEVNALWDEDRGGDFASVTTCLCSLSDDEVDADIEGILDMVRGTNHVGTDNASGMELIDSPLWGNTDCRQTDVRREDTDVVQRLWKGRGMSRVCLQK